MVRDDIEQGIEEARREGESALGEWFLARPNRFSAERTGGDALAIGALALLCFVPIGPLAVVRALRCADQHDAVGRRAPPAAIVGGTLGVVATLVQVALVAYLLFL